jgi:hypothetical protein
MPSSPVSPLLNREQPPAQQFEAREAPSGRPMLPPSGGYGAHGELYNNHTADSWRNRIAENFASVQSRFATRNRNAPALRSKAANAAAPTEAFRNEIDGLRRIIFDLHSQNLAGTLPRDGKQRIDAALGELEKHAAIYREQGQGASYDVDVTPAELASRATYAAEALQDAKDVASTMPWSMPTSHVESLLGNTDRNTFELNRGIVQSLLDKQGPKSESDIDTFLNAASTLLQLNQQCKVTLDGISRAGETDIARMSSLHERIKQSDRDIHSLIENTLDSAPPSADTRSGHPVTASHFQDVHTHRADFLQEASDTTFVMRTSEIEAYLANAESAGRPFTAEEQEAINIHLDDLMASTAPRTMQAQTLDSLIEDIDSHNAAHPAHESPMSLYGPAARRAIEPLFYSGGGRSGRMAPPHTTPGGAYTEDFDGTSDTSSEASFSVGPGPRNVRPSPQRSSAFIDAYQRVGTVLAAAQRETRPFSDAERSSIALNLDLMQGLQELHAPNEGLMSRQLATMADQINAHDHTYAASRHSMETVPAGFPPPEPREMAPAQQHAAVPAPPLSETAPLPEPPPAGPGPKSRNPSRGALSVSRQFFSELGSHLPDRGALADRVKTKARRAMESPFSSSLFRRGKNPAEETPVTEKKNRISLRNFKFSSGLLPRANRPEKAAAMLPAEPASRRSFTPEPPGSETEPDNGGHDVSENALGNTSPNGRDNSITPPGSGEDGAGTVIFNPSIENPVDAIEPDELDMDTYSIPERRYSPSQLSGSGTDGDRGSIDGADHASFVSDEDDINS